MMDIYIEIENFLLSCGARYIGYRVGYEFVKPLVLGDAAVGFRYWGYPYAIYTSLGEGIKVDLRTREVRCETGMNEVYFPWPTDTALLCQILHILTNQWACHKLDREECCELKGITLKHLLK